MSRYMEYIKYTQKWKYSPSKIKQIVGVLLFDNISLLLEKINLFGSMAYQKCISSITNSCL